MNGVNDVSIIERFHDAVSSDSNVLFMKGTVAFPLCGLSGEVCFLLKRCNLQFKSIDVLADPELHTFLIKLHADFSMPYMYAYGGFVGGYNELCEICMSGNIERLYSAHVQGVDFSVGSLQRRQFK
jgi:monothiol glutaredoxin